MRRSIVSFTLACITLAAACGINEGGLLDVLGSFDGHRETTFGMLHPVAPHYSTLLRFDPQNYPKIVGDVAWRGVKMDPIQVNAVMRDLAIQAIHSGVGIPDHPFLVGK